MTCKHEVYCQHRDWEATTDTEHYETPGLIARLFSRAPRRYPHTASAAWPQTQPVIHIPPEPQSNINTTELQPGEMRSSTRYRPKTIHDIVPQAVYSAVFAASIGGVVYAANGTARQVIGWFSGTFAGMFLLTAFPVVLLDGGNVVSMLETLTRTDINGDGRIGDLAVDLNADIPGEGTGTQKTRVRLPIAMVRAWHRFCQDVNSKACNFSGNSAVRHGLDRGWFDALVASWAGHDRKRALVDPETVGPRKTPKLTDSGRDVIGIHATTPPSELVTLLEQLTGTDRQQTDS